MTFSTTGQEACDLLLQFNICDLLIKVTTRAGLTICPIVILDFLRKGEMMNVTYVNHVTDNLHNLPLDSIFVFRDINTAKTEIIL